MTQHRLNEADVGSIVEHGGGHAVTEQMTAATFAGVGFVDL